MKKARKVALTILLASCSAIAIARNISSGTPSPIQIDLIQATQSGDLNGVKKTLAGGANVNFQNANYFGYTPLMYAARNNRPDIVQYLLLHGADIHVEDQYANNALQIAKNFNSKNSNQESIDILQKALSKTR